MAGVAVPLLTPVALREAIDARRIFQARGLHAPSLLHARRAYLSRVHLIPPSVDLDAGLIIDIGANEGSFSAAVARLAPHAEIIACEPNPAPRERLRKRLGDRVTIVDQAIGLEPGRATFNITAMDHNSSLREPRSEEMGALLDDAGWEVTERVDVEVTTLDLLVGDRDVAVVKLDVQGAELDVLLGGTNALARTQAVLMEVTFFSHYEADATFGALHARMVDLGFELVAMAQPALAGAQGRFAWSDACYARVEKDLVTSPLAEGVGVVEQP
ncbi:methyltransferase [Baekduia alba]|nr:methyltransferase [Baekduia alba]